MVNVLYGYRQPMVIREHGRRNNSAGYPCSMGAVVMKVNRCVPIPAQHQWAFNNNSPARAYEALSVVRAYEPAHIPDRMRPRKKGKA